MIGFILGFFIGTCFGLVMTALLAVAAQDDIIIKDKMGEEK